MPCIIVQIYIHLCLYFISETRELQTTMLYCLYNLYYFHSACKELESNLRLYVLCPEIDHTTVTWWSIFQQTSFRGPIPNIINLIYQSKCELVHSMKDGIGVSPYCSCAWTRLCMFVSVCAHTDIGR